MINLLNTSNLYQKIDFSLLKSCRFNIDSKEYEVILNKIYSLVDSWILNLNSSNIYEIISFYHYDFIIEKEENTKYKSFKRAQIKIDKNMKSIIVYEDSIDELFSLSKKYNLNLSKKQIIDLHVTHELFHLLEYEIYDDIYKLLPKIKTKSFLKKEHYVLEYSEIASYYFCTKILNLKFHPQILDYLIIYENDHFKKQEIYNKLEVKL